MLEPSWSVDVDDWGDVYRFEARDPKGPPDGWSYAHEVAVGELAEADDAQIGSLCEMMRRRAATHHDLVRRANRMTIDASGDFDLETATAYLPHLNVMVEWMPYEQDDLGAWNVDLAHARTAGLRDLAAACSQAPRASYDVDALETRVDARDVSVSYADPDTVDVTVSDAGDAFPEVVLLAVPVETDTDAIMRRIDQRLADLREAAARGWDATSVQAWAATTVKVKAHPSDGRGAVEQRVLPVTHPGAPIEWENLSSGQQFGSLRAQGNERSGRLLEQLNRR